MAACRQGAMLSYFTYQEKKDEEAWLELRNLKKIKNNKKARHAYIQESNNRWWKEKISQ